MKKKKSTWQIYLIWAATLTLGFFIHLVCDDVYTLMVLAGLALTMLVFLVELKERGGVK